MLMSRCLFVITAVFTISAAVGCGQTNSPQGLDSDQDKKQDKSSTDYPPPYLRPLNNSNKYYLKLGLDGSPLVIQDAQWDASGSEEQGTLWHCIQDVKTGLVWENKAEKSTSPRSHLANYRYAQNRLQADTPPSTPSLCPDILCTTQSYVEYVNQQQLCGFSNWQLPTVLQFQTIVNHQLTPRAIDTHYFPLAVNSHYWTQQSYAPDRKHAWYVYFSDGSVSHTLKDQPMFLRLVSPAQSAPTYSINN